MVALIIKLTWELVSYNWEYTSHWWGSWRKIRINEDKTGKLILYVLGGLDKRRDAKPQNVYRLIA